MAYTPGVARVCMAINRDPDKARALTIKQNTRGRRHRRHGRARAGRHRARRRPCRSWRARRCSSRSSRGVDAWPICLDTKDTDEIITIVKAIAPGFGGINLEDISAPRCFEIEGRLRQELDIPVFHDDQHGTAVVVLAALLNAAKVVGKPIGGPARRAGRGGRRRRRREQAPDGGRRARHRRLRPRGGAPSRQEGADGDQEVVREEHQPARVRRHRRRGPARRGRLPGPVRPRRRLGRGREDDGPGRDRVRDGQPRARGAPRGARGPHPRDRHRPLRLPQPDQQRARVPGHLPRALLDAPRPASTRR